MIHLAVRQPAVLLIEGDLARGRAKVLLRLLHEKRGSVVTKAEILEKVWNLHPDTETRAVDNFVVRLRKYLESDPSNPKLLLTVRGAGYRLENPPP